MNPVLAVLAFGFVFLLDAALPQPNPVVNVSQKADKEGLMPKTPHPAVVHQVHPKSTRCARAATFLRTIAQNIKTCPRTTEFDGSKDHEQPQGPLAQARLYYGPPVNVTWVVRSDSRGPAHEGYVQFSLPRKLSLPPEFPSQWTNDVVAIFSDMNEGMPSLQYRYKFHIGRDGVHLTKILVRNARQHEWKEAPARERTCSPFGCAPVCWQRADQ